jgi:hypothetical protein
MNVKWLIEDWDPDNNYQRLYEEVKRQGYKCELISYVPFKGGSYEVFSPTDCVVVQASLNLARQLMEEKKWIPGPWLNLREYECSYYYAYLGDLLFNDDYIMIPVRDFKRVKDICFKRLGKRDSLFIRPNSGFKTFTGKVFSKRHFDKDWDWVEEFCTPEDLIVISTPKDIKAEWRFIAAESDIISGSMYKYNGISEYKSEWPDKAINLAKDVAKKYHPDPVYTVDICMGADDRFYLLEVGSFSCAGLYACDMEPIVRVASNIALDEWKDLQD